MIYSLNCNNYFFTHLAPYYLTFKIFIYNPKFTKYEIVVDFVGPLSSSYDTLYPKNMIQKLKKCKCDPQKVIYYADTFLNFHS